MFGRKCFCRRNIVAKIFIMEKSFIQTPLIYYFCLTKRPSSVFPSYSGGPCIVAKIGNLKAAEKQENEIIFAPVFRQIASHDAPIGLAAATFGSTVLRVYDLYLNYFVSNLYTQHLLTILS